MGWRKLYDEEFHDLYCSPNIIQAIISRWEGQAVCAALMRRDEICVHNFNQNI